MKQIYSGEISLKKNFFSLSKCMEKSLFTLQVNVTNRRERHLSKLLHRNLALLILFQLVETALIYIA